MFGLKQKAELAAELQWVRNNAPSPSQDNYTPDMIRLEGREWSLVFLYDEHQEGRKLHPQIQQETATTWSAFSKGQNFALWKKRLGKVSFPIALDGADRHYSGLGYNSKRLKDIDPSDISPLHLGRIKGQVLAVRPHVIEFLDNYYLNGVEFDRIRTRAIIPYNIQYGHRGIDDNTFVAEVRCWMYYGKKDYWVPQLDAGYLYRPVGAFAPRVRWCDGHRIGIYYAYTRLEYETNG